MQLLVSKKNLLVCFFLYLISSAEPAFSQSKPASNKKEFNYYNVLHIGVGTGAEKDGLGSSIVLNWQYKLISNASPIAAGLSGDFMFAKNKLTDSSSVIASIKYGVEYAPKLTDRIRPFFGFDIGYAHGINGKNDKGGSLIYTVPVGVKYFVANRFALAAFGRYDHLSYYNNFIYGLDLQFTISK